MCGEHCSTNTADDVSILQRSGWMDSVISPLFNTLMFTADATSLGPEKSTVSSVIGSDLPCLWLAVEEAVKPLT